MKKKRDARYEREFKNRVRKEVVNSFQQFVYNAEKFFFFFFLTLPIITRINIFYFFFLYIFLVLVYSYNYFFLCFSIIILCRLKKYIIVTA
jgi:hypothetical protein